MPLAVLGLPQEVVPTLPVSEGSSDSLCLHPNQLLSPHLHPHPHPRPHLDHFSLHTHIQPLHTPKSYHYSRLHWSPASVLVAPLDSCLPPDLGLWFLTAGGLRLGSNVLLRAHNPWVSILGSFPHTRLRHKNSWQD